MWKDYSVSYLKHNRAASISIMVGAFISSLFLSLLCSLFYNIWLDDINRILLDEGGWQVRIEAELDAEELTVIQNYANVETIQLNEQESRNQTTVYELTFHHPRTIYQDVPLILEQLNRTALNQADPNQPVLDSDAVTFHTHLLSRYLIHDPQDDTPPMLLSFYLLLLFVAALALVLIIHNSFAVSMQARIHQFGILSSVGASPAQIRLCLMQEAAALCLPPLLLGSLSGIALCYGTIQGVNALAGNWEGEGRMDAVFSYHPLLLIGTLLLSIATVLFSAWIPARRLSRLSPLEAVRGEGIVAGAHSASSRSTFRRRKHSPLLFLLFGIEGTLAGNSLKARRQALRTTMLSLTLSFLAFTVFSCFAAFSRLSVYETSFSKYQDFWDIYMTVKDTDIEDFQNLEQIEAIENVEDAALYQKAEAWTVVSPSQLGDTLTSLGGLPAVAGQSVPMDGENYLVKVPLVILEDGAFDKYCEQLGIELPVQELSSLPENGVIILNQIWDSLHSNFRNRAYLPFLQETPETLALQNKDNSQAAVLPVLACTDEAPILWEQYEDYTLAAVLPLSLWNTFSDQVEKVEADTMLRIFTYEDARLDADMDEIRQIAEEAHVIEIHNRIQDIHSDDLMWEGIAFFMNAGCALLAVIGIANIFSHTLGFISQRRQEFAQYLSIGVTPRGIQKILWIEALSIAGRPVLVTLPLTWLVMLLMIKASYMEPAKCIPVMPFGAIAVFIAAIFLAVGLAYYLGGRRLCRSSLSELLRSDHLC